MIPNPPSCCPRSTVLIDCEVSVAEPTILTSAPEGTVPGVTFAVVSNTCRGPTVSPVVGTAVPIDAPKAFEAAKRCVPAVSSVIVVAMSHQMLYVTVSVFVVLGLFHCTPVVVTLTGATGVVTVGNCGIE